MGLRKNNFTMFKVSKPWGYYPVDVEEKIKQYETTLKEVTDKSIEIKQENLSLKQKIKSLQEELKQMHFQMSSLELPETEEVIENYILNGFKNYNTVSNDQTPENLEKPDKPEKINLDKNKQYNNKIIDKKDDNEGTSGFIIAE